MRLLWVKAGKLLPVDTGGKIRSYNLLCHLAQQLEQEVGKVVTAAVRFADEIPFPAPSALHTDVIREE